MTRDLLSAAVAYHQAGRLAAAERLYEEVLLASPADGDALHFLGLIAHQSGNHAAALERLDAAIAARPDAAAFHNNRGSVLLALDRAEDAAASYRDALSLHPEYVEALSNLGGALLRLGQASAAEEACRRALALQPGHAEAHNNLGGALRDQGNNDAAEASFNTALAVQPDHAEAHLNLGNVLQERGDLAAAETSYRRALGLRPDHADALCNLAIAHRAGGRNAEALDGFAAAAAARPDQARFHHELGITLDNLGRSAEAVAALRQAVRLDGQNVIFAYALARALGHGDDLGEDTRRDAADYLARPDADPQPLRRVVVREMRAAAAAVGLLDGLRQEGSATSVDLDRAMTLFEDPLRRSYIAKDRLTDADLERLAAAVRRAFLEGVTHDGVVSAERFAILTDLADHYVLNEYVAEESADEEATVGALVNALVEQVERGERPEPEKLAAVALYRSLTDLPPSLAELAADLPPPLAEFVDRQLAEAAAEIAHRDRIETLTEMGGAVSSIVRDQYEENPYPRWRVVHLPESRPLAVVMSEMFPHLAKMNWARPRQPRVLVAGCGTGKHLMQTARGFADAEVTAIDLSRASLAYAMRQADRLAVDNIRFAQADIMRLAPETGPFDIIECSGVLHHLENPVAGWRILADRLAAGGFMAVGLYSRRARRHVAAARAFRDQQGYPATVQGLRHCRRDILALPVDHPARPVAASSDFYTLSSFRDLVFHVQEHVLDLPDIAAAIAELGLEFIGFIHPHATVHAAYRARFPNDPDATDLAHWDAFEADNPDTFAGMYQFWLRKP